MLFDKNTKQITAVLDFDWASISNPFKEFLSGLNDIGGNISGIDDKIEAAILSGDFTMPPADRDDTSTKRWETAKVWHTLMKNTGVITPSDINSVNKIYDMLQFHRLLCPFQLGNEFMLKQIDDEKKAGLRAKTEADLVQWLEKHGF